MRKVKTDNNDLIQYLDTIKELKNHIPIEEYRNEYRRLRSDDVPLIKAQKFKSAHTELRRLDRKKESLLDNLSMSLTLLTKLPLLLLKTLISLKRIAYIEEISLRKAMKKLLP